MFERSKQGILFYSEYYKYFVFEHFEGFSGRIISQNHDVNCPPLPCYLTPLDFFLLPRFLPSFIPISKVYANKILLLARLFIKFIFIARLSIFKNLMSFHLIISQVILILIKT